MLPTTLKFQEQRGFGQRLTRLYPKQVFVSYIRDLLLSDVLCMFPVDPSLRLLKNNPVLNWNFQFPCNAPQQLRDLDTQTSSI